MGKLGKFCLGVLACLWLAACGQVTQAILPTLVPTLSVPVTLDTDEPKITPIPPATPDLQGYPGQILPAPLPQGYPGGGGFVFPTLTPIPTIQWSVPVSEITGWSEFPLAEFRAPQTSPNLEVRCEFEASKLTLWVNNEQLSDASLSFFEIESPSCPNKIDPAADSSAAVLSFPQGEAYLWRADGLPPKPLGRICAPQFSSLWSPNSQKLALSLRPCQIGFQNNAQIQILDSWGNPQAEFLIGGGTDGEDVVWKSNSIVCRGDRNRVPCHSANTGDFLFAIQGWHVITGGAKGQQTPGISPNERWLLLDESYFDHNFDGREGIRQNYILFDTWTTVKYLLPNSGENPVAFAGWSLDSTTAYLVSRPFQADSLPMPDMPFGLFALDVHSRQLTMLFKEAVYVWWSPNQQYALVAFPARNEQGALTLVAGIWQVDTENLVGRVPLADEVIYMDPGWDFQVRGSNSNKSSFGSAFWSNNGRKVILRTPRGDLFLMGVDGSVQNLAENFSRAVSEPITYTWALDDSKILIQAGSRAWVVEVD